MDHSSRARVAVIGGGVAGLASAKVLKHDGFAVTVFEREPTVGGVWAPSRTYPWLRTNNPRETYVFSDFPYPDTVDEFPSAEQVRDYLRSYAEYFELGPHLNLGTEVVSVSRCVSQGDEPHPGFEVIVRPVNDPAAAETHHFDFVVVCNGVFSEPSVPQFDGEQDFAGSVLHSSQLTDPEAVTGKRVVVVGAGKSALDCASFAGHRAASCTLVFRTPHWMLPRYLFERIRVDRVLLTRLSELMLPAYHRVGRTETILRIAGAPLLWFWWRAQSWLMARLVGMPKTMVPADPLPAGIETIGIGGEFYTVLRRGMVRAKRASVVSFSGPETVELDTGEQVDADVVVFATGWRQNVSFLDQQLLRKVKPHERFQLYRFILPPDERHLGFIGYASSSASPLLSEVSAHWLSHCFRGDLILPCTAEMKREVARVQRWLVKVFPARRQGYFIGAYIAHYTDELMRDMGLRTRRSSNVLSEYLAPLWSERYSGLTDERHRSRGGGELAYSDRA